ncbi:MAG: hypothetical protein JW876_06335 [Candidatus Krumholzibacteriota bacterium]|nr:hypothetical protein [Candidatus Krumholzibacteriota bacterium]
MKREHSIGTRRAWIVLNYAALVLFIAVFAAAARAGWGFRPAAALVCLAAVGIWSFVSLYGRTGLWRLVHAPGDRLDEREVQLTREALRYAYAVFTVIALVYLLLANIVSRFPLLSFEPKTRGSLGMIAVMGLLYLAHTLPAAVIAWRERRIAVD